MTIGFTSMERYMSFMATALHEAKTLRERALIPFFAVKVPDAEVGEKKDPAPVITLALTGIMLLTAPVSLRELYDACANIEAARAQLSSILFSQLLHADPELIVPLQDLADIIAWEASEAFTASYYPAPLDVEPLTDEHVDTVMAALQREMDREAHSRHKTPTRFAGLPRERQRALAERRRVAYGLFGITPERWTTATYSIFEIDDDPTTLERLFENGVLIRPERPTSPAPEQSPVLLLGPPASTPSPSPFWWI